MREISMAEMMDIFDNDDVARGMNSVIPIKNRLLVRRDSVAEWVYVELP